MTQAIQPLPSSTPSWPINLAAYDRTPVLSESERAALEYIFTQPHGQIRKTTKRARTLERLTRPIQDVLWYIHASSDDSFAVIRIICLEMYSRGTPFWAWSLEAWRDILGPDLTHFSQKYARMQHPARSYLPLVVYLLDAIPDVWPLVEMLEIRKQAQRVFKREVINQAALRLRATLQRWGISKRTSVSTSA